MITVSALVGFLGMLCVVSKRSIVGVLMGFQLMSIGAALALVSAGVSADKAVDGFWVGLLIVLGGVAQTMVGLAAASRLFFQTGDVDMRSLRSMRN